MFDSRNNKGAQNKYTGYAGGSTTQYLGTLNFDAASSWTGATSEEGNSQSHNNIQPYIVTYMWKRVS